MYLSYRKRLSRKPRNLRPEMLQLVDSQGGLKHHNNGNINCAGGGHLWSKTKLFRNKVKARCCLTDNTSSGIDKNSLNSELYNLFRLYEINSLVTFLKFMSISEVLWQPNDVLVVCELHKTTPFNLIIARALNVLQVCRYQSGFPPTSQPFSCVKSMSRKWDRLRTNRLLGHICKS